MSTPDSTPTPASGISLTSLSDRCRELAREAERVSDFDAAMRLGALEHAFADLLAHPPEDEEDRRSALITELGMLTERLRGS